MGKTTLRPLSFREPDAGGYRSFGIDPAELIVA